METLAQQLQDALGTGVAVYLGSEYLDRQPQLPLVIVLPGSVRYDAPDGSVADALAMGTAETTLVCKAVTFEEAALLADLCYAAIGPGEARHLAAALRDVGRLHGARGRPDHHVPGRADPQRHHPRARGPLHAARPVHGHPGGGP